jgi:DNA-binding transcriptional LysR family regulator
MEFIHLDAFVRVAREGTFTRAAELLNLTQPAVSMRIAQLEAELGSPLFERRGKRLTLTPAGETFLPYAERLLAVLADGVQAVKQVRQGKSGEVRIAAPAPFVLTFLVDVLESFRRQHPTIDILIRERPKTTILEMLRDNSIMLGLVNAPVFDGSLSTLARFADPIRAVVAHTHPLAQFQASPIPVEHIYQHTIFRVSMFPEMTMVMDDLVEQARQGSGGAVIAVPMVMALKLVMDGQGITLLPESYVKSAVKSGELVFLTIADMPRLLSQPLLIAHKDRELNRVHQAFVHLLRDRWRHLLVE